MSAATIIQQLPSSLLAKADAKGEKQASMAAICDLYVCHNPKAVNPATGEIVYLARENSTGKLVWMKADNGRSPPPDQIISRASEDGKIPQELIEKLRKVGEAAQVAPVLIINGDGVNLSAVPQIGNTVLKDSNSSTEASKTKKSAGDSHNTRDLNFKLNIKNGSRENEPKVPCAIVKSVKKKAFKSKSKPIIPKIPVGSPLSSASTSPKSSSSSSTVSVKYLSRVGKPRPKLKTKSLDVKLGTKRPSSSDTVSISSTALTSQIKKNAIKESSADKMLSTKTLPPFVRSSSSSSGAKPRPRKRRKFGISHRKLKKPKRPKTGYNYFQLSIRDKLCDKVPMDDRVLHNETVARIIGKKWKALSKQERKVFQTLAEQDKNRYECELKAYLRKVYELGVENRFDDKDDRKQSRVRSLSFDSSLSTGRLPPLSVRKKLAEIEEKQALKLLDIEEEEDGGESDRESMEEEERADREEEKSTKSADGPLLSFMEEKSKLGQEISSALGVSLSPPHQSLEHFAPKDDNWLNDALSSHFGSSRLRSSVSCENLPLSSGIFDPAGIFAEKLEKIAEKPLNDRKLSNPFASDDLLSSFRGDSLFDNPPAKSSGGFPLCNIDNLFFKEFSAWDDA
mmetsp:Transcript_9897/g.24347  ORF Transcript_9897/g.24347 Transcript_9897/m.24347 type:complete len:624 (+) Transcript_9897:336-2207(+)